MGTTLFCCLVFFTSVLTLLSQVQTQSTPVPAKYISIYIGDNQNVITGQSTVTLQGRSITDINIGQISNQTIKVTSGGIGLNTVTFDYNFNVSSLYPFFIAIYTDDETAEGDFNDIEEYMTKLEKERETKTIQDGITITISDIDVYNSKTDARTESTSHRFDNNVVWNCYATAIWDNGKGSTQVQGGIAENQITVQHQIPAGFMGTANQYCVYVEGQLTRRKLQPVLPDVLLEVMNVEDEEQHYIQFYGTVIPGTFGLTWLAIQPANILQVDGGVTWKNGDGNVAVNGGVGTNYIEVRRDDDAATAYGTFLYDMSYTQTTNTTTTTAAGN